MEKRNTKITLSSKEKEYLEIQTRARTIQAQTVTRAKVLLLRSEGNTIEYISDKLDINRNSVILCLKKYLEGGVKNALYDAPGRGRNPEITDDEKSWIISVACQKPADLGYSAETWTYVRLTKHINENAESAGFPRLSTIAKATVNRVLKSADIKPYKITYYCEKRDTEFDTKMHNVLLVYKQLSFFDDEEMIICKEQPLHVLSYDEKPGIQAIATTSEDIRPDMNHSTISRDYEYKRLGTISLLATIDLQTGEAIPLVSEKHGSSEYIEFLKLLDSKYPKGDKIRLILDNLKVHSSKETRNYLETVPERFEFVFTPKHSLWLNMIEGFFSKMTRQMLRGIRVKSKQELVDRIYRYFDEVNEVPVVFRWKYRLDEIDGSELPITETLI